MNKAYQLKNCTVAGKKIREELHNWKVH